MALKKLAKKAAGRNAEPDVSRPPGLGSLMPAVAGGLAAAAPAAASGQRYTDLAELPIGIDVKNQLFSGIQPLATADGSGGQWWMADMGLNEGGAQNVSHYMNDDAQRRLDGYTYDWEPTGKRNEGWLTAYKPDGTQAGRFWQQDTSGTQSFLEAAGLALAGFGGLGALTGLGPLGFLGGGAGAGAGSSASGGTAAAGSAGGAGGAGAGAAAGGAAAGGTGAGTLAGSVGAAEMAAGLGEYAASGLPAAVMTPTLPGLAAAGGAAAAAPSLMSAVGPAELTAGLGEFAGSGLPSAAMSPSIPGLAATGASAAPAVFNAAADSQAANAALGLGANSGSVPAAVNLGSAGGIASTGGGWGVLDPIAGALDSAKGAVAGVVGDKGADLLWNLGKGAIGTAIADKAADALAPKIDTSAVTAQANFANDIAKRQMDLAEKQYADQQALLAQYSPMIQEMIRGQITDQGLSRERSTAQWNDYTNVWRPTELAFNKQSMDFANPARYQQEADRAGVDAATQFDRAKQAQVRQLQMSGASPEKIAALTAAGDILAARGTAGARSQAFRDAEMKGLNVLQGAASFGRNMPSTGIQTAALAGQQGQQGMAGVQGLSSLSAAPATIASNLMSQSLNAGNTATQSLLQAQNLGLQAANNRNAIFGDILGAGLGAIGMSGGLGQFFGGRP